MLETSQLARGSVELLVRILRGYLGLFTDIQAPDISKLQPDGKRTARHVTQQRWRHLQWSARRMICRTISCCPRADRLPKAT